MARIGSTGTASLDFSDGDTLKRFTIVDAQVQPNSYILPGIQRSAADADVDDQGWVYNANTVAINPLGGAFDVLVNVMSGESVMAPGEYPGEVVTLVYAVI